MNFAKHLVPLLSVALLLLLGACTATHDSASPQAQLETVEPQAVESPKELPSFHYVFAHQYLPRSLYTDPELGLALAFLEDKQDLLLTMWDSCQKGAPELTRHNSPTGLKIEGGRIAKNAALAVITMPQPNEMPEAYYLCVLTTFTLGSDGAPRAENVGYYTLERSITQEGDNKADEATEVPTIIGGWDKDNKHINYGPGPKPDTADEFVFTILEQIKKVR